MKKRDFLNSIMDVCLAILRSSVSIPYCDILIPGLEDYVCTVQDPDTRNSKRKLDSSSEERLYVAPLRSMVFFFSTNKQACIGGCFACFAEQTGGVCLL